MTVCSPFQVLEISDGTTTVNLLSPKSGFCLLSWSPAIAEPKGGGVWKDSQLAAGRQLAMRKLANVADAFVLAVRDHWPDDLIRDTQNLRRLLEKACSYRTSKWQDEEVWIKRQGVYEAYPTYTLIEDYRTPQDGNPHGSSHFWTAMGNSAFPEFKLVVEHEPWWRADVPGTGTCVQTSGQQVWNRANWELNFDGAGANHVNAMIELSTTRLLALEPGECWRTDNGVAWFAAAVPPGMSVYGSALEASDGDVFFTAEDIGGNTEFWRSQNVGVNWVQRHATTGSRNPHAIAEFGAYLYMAILSTSVSDGFARSNDDGATWTYVRYVPGSNGSPMAILAGSDGYLYGTEEQYTPYVGRIVRTLDGVNWTVIKSDPGLYFGRLIAEPGDGYLYVGAYPYLRNEFWLWRSSDGLDWDVIAILPFTANYWYYLILSGDGYYYMTNDVVTVWHSDDTFSWTQVYNTGDLSTHAPIVEYSVNDCLYVGCSNEIWSRCADEVTVGRAATCTDEVYVANKHGRAQLTHVKVYDASAAPPADYTDQFPAAAFPFDLLPNPMANGDIVYFGSQTSVEDSGPFDNAVCDITRSAAGTFQLTWEYSDGLAGWPALNENDGTADFVAPGVNSVHWVPPDAAAPGGVWAAEAVNGVTAYWIRAVVGGVAGNPVGPQQGNRDVYTCNWPHVDVDDAQVLGDIPALMQFKFHNRSDEDGYEVTIDELDTLENRVVCGLRSLSRGTDFTAFLNCADEQNPIGVSVSVGANSAFGDDITAPTGRYVLHTTTGLSTWADQCIFTLASTVARDFYGSFHAYVRAQEVDWDAAIDEVRVRLQVRTGSGGVTFTTGHKPFRNLNDWQLLDFGALNVPASGLLSSDDLGDESEIAIQVWSSAAALYVNLYDLVLIPTDEWALDAVDKAMEDDSGVTNGYVLDVDSVTYPKRDIRALVRVADDVGLIRSTYQPNTPGHAMLQANADQRLWFLTARGCVTGSHTGADDQTTLTDSSASFLTSGVQTGQVIFNVTDGSAGFVGATVTATTITDCGLAGGTDNDWDTNDEYLIICPNWKSEPWNCHSVQMWNNARYLSMRGAR